MKMKGKKRIFLIIFLGIFTGILLKTFFFDIIIIEGSSMEPNFHEGQLAFVNKLAFGLDIPFSSRAFVQWSEPKKGDVIIYLIDDNLVIKRCAATGGTPLEYSYDSGYNLHVDDKTIPLTDGQFNRMKDYTSVPAGTILAIGDNSAVSIDSRTYGFVSVKNILGKVICRPTDF